MRVIRFLQKDNFFRKIIYTIALHRTKKLVRQFEKHLDKNNTILDIGSGLCTVCEVLRKKGYKINPLDTQDLSFVDGINPLIYNGDKIPFKNNTFDVSLLLTVLHHTPYPEAILKEAKRVSKKMIVIEDIHHNIVHKYLTYFLIVF